MTVRDIDQELLELVRINRLAFFRVFFPKAMGIHPVFFSHCGTKALQGKTHYLRMMFYEKWIKMGTLHCQLRSLEGES